VSTIPGSINHCNGNGSLIARSYAYSSPVPCLSVEGPLRGPLTLCFGPITANSPYDSYTKQMASSRQRSLRFLLRSSRRKPPSRYRILLARAAAMSFPLHAAVHAVSSRRRINATLSTINIPVASSYWPEATNSSEADTWKHTLPFRSQIWRYRRTTCFRVSIGGGYLRSSDIRCVRDSSGGMIIIICSSNARRILPCFNAVQPYKRLV
jgi:hypothetical protein